MDKFASESWRPDTPGTDSGITLLEAYSALVQRAGRDSSGVEVPFPGRPLGTDRDCNLWTIRIKQID